MENISRLNIVYWSFIDVTDLSNALKKRLGGKVLIASKCAKMKNKKHLENSNWNGNNNAK